MVIGQERREKEKRRMEKTEKLAKHKVGEEFIHM